MGEVQLRIDTEEAPSVPVPPQPSAPQPPKKEEAAGHRHMRFAHKITLLAVCMICLTGLSITFLTVTQFKREMYKRERSAAYMAYSAVVNYLTAHHHSHRGNFSPKAMDYVIRNKMLRLKDPLNDQITHRPERMAVFDEQGLPIYEFIRTEEFGPPKVKPLPADRLRDDVRLDYDRRKGMVHLQGPIAAQDDDIPGYVEISFNSSIWQKVNILFTQAFLIMCGVILIAIVVTLMLDQKVLAPIAALTAAAQRIRKGNLSQQVSVESDDEIGTLASTFNNMISSLKTRITLLHSIQDWTVKIGKELESERLYGTLVSMFSVVSTSRACRIYTYDKSRKELITRLERGAAHLPEPQNDKLTLRALHQRWTEYLKADGKIVSDPTGAVELAIPLISGEKPIGAIRIGRKQNNTVFSDEEITILQTLAQHASVSLDNAHLYEELSEKERIEQEMIWARRIQQELLPHCAPEIPGYEVFGGSIPALEVAGDYFDYITIDGNRWYLVIADVSGKGVPAALIMSVTRSLLQAYVDYESSPLDVLCKVNRRISQTIDSEMFVTIAVMCLDARENRISIARAGHEPVFMFNGSDQIEKIAPAGAAMGLLDPVTFRQSLRPFEGMISSGNVILLYTDGITEAQNKDGEEFGYQRIEQLLLKHASESAQNIYNIIINAVEEFAANQAQHDDITMLILKKTE